LKVTAKVALVALILLLALVAPVLADERDDADRAYRSGDYATSLRIYRRLAEKGDASAQTSLGVMYDKGQGVTQDDIVAVMWYRKAAHQSHAQGQFNLAVKFAEGNGVPQDYVRSHMWFDLAVRNYAASATENRNEAIKNRDLVAAKMTPAQIAEARRLARKWKPRNKRSGNASVVAKFAG
jgi:hypothetical protein